METIKIGFIMVCLLLSGCTAEFLDQKPAKNLVILTSIDDFQALLDRTSVFNEKGSQSLAILSTDDYFLSESSWRTMSSAFQRNAYVWNAEIFEGSQSADWDNGYERIFYANVAIEGLNKLVPVAKEQQYWNNVMARALFHRAWNHFNLLALFGEYGKAKDDLAQKKGIPLRSESDINIPVTRSSVKEVYELIINDLTRAEKLFDDQISVIERPTKYATLALLARVYTYFQEYDKAYSYASTCLAMKDELINYNDLDHTKAFPLPAYGVGNKEILFNAWQPSTTALAQNRLCVDTVLMDLYDVKDKRISIFFKSNGLGNDTFKGSYMGNSLLFSGISLSEVYLIAMEAATRNDKLNEALILYNNLRRRRYLTNEYLDQVMVPKEQLLKLILDEKRRELVMRASRWEDLKRFNNTDGISKVLLRKLGTETYSLNPFDKRYSMPIPQYVLTYSSVNQNER